METQFEVKTTFREEHLAAFISKHLRLRKPMLVVYAILIIGWFLEGTLYRSTFMLGLCAIMVAMAIWLYRRPKTLAKKMIEQEQKFLDTEEVTATVLFGDVIRSTRSRCTNEIPYDKVTKIYHTKYGMVLLDVRNRFVLLDKDGFTKGTFEKFVPFIQEKCPQAKIYKK